VAGPSAGRAPESAAGAPDRRAGDAGADGVPPEPVDPDEPDPYDDIDPAAPTVAVQDPEQAAMELLAARLGARRLDQQG
jgi:hypothetical protein